MPIKFDIKLTEKDMYRFNLYHAFTSLRGYLPLLLGAALIGIVQFSGKFHGWTEKLPYTALGIVLLFYMPISLYFSSKRQIALSETLRETLHFSVSEKGITVSVSSSEEKAELPWQYIYKIISTKHNILIYSNRVNAYVIPKSQVQEQMTVLFDLFQKHCEAYRLHLKR